MKHKVLKAADQWLSSQINPKNKILNAFIRRPNDWASKSAEDAHPEQAANQIFNDGNLFVIKDNICTADGPTTCASDILREYQSPFAASAAHQLRCNGALIDGTTNLDEFGMGSHSTYSAYGQVRNHLNSEGQPLSAGGSSGGSAVAVATGQCFAALGTDTGGSVRLPAAYTGIVGFKPSYGYISRWGVVPYANSLDTVGILAPTCEAALQIFPVISRYDPKDPTICGEKTRARTAAPFKRREGQPNPKRFRIGVPKEYNTRELEPTVRNVWLKTLQRLQALGHSIHPVSLPMTQVALSVYYVIAAAEASSNLAKYDGVRYGNQAFGNDSAGQSLYSGTRGAGLGKEVQRRILLGSYSLSADAIDNYFIKAQKVRRLVQQDFNKVFRQDHPLLPLASSKGADDGVDFLVTPTAQSLPPTLESVTSKDSVDSFADDVLTVPASLAGVPALSVPVAVSEAHSKNPDEPSTVGIQMIAQYGCDLALLGFGCDVQTSV